PGGIARLGKMPRRGEDRDRVESDARGELRAATDLHQVPEKTETGDVGQRVYALHLRQLNPGRVEPGGGIDHLLVGLVAQLALLQGRAHYADTQPFAEYQDIARARPVVALHLPWIHETERDEAVERLRSIDRVAARDRYAGCLAYGVSARGDALD